MWGVKNCHHLFQFTSNKEQKKIPNITGFEWKINWHFPLCFTYTPRCWCSNEESIKKVEKFLIGHYLEKFSNGTFSSIKKKYNIGRNKEEHKKKNREEEAFWVHFNLNFMNRTVLWSFYLHHRMFRYTSYTNIILMYIYIHFTRRGLWKLFVISLYSWIYFYFYIFFNLNLLLKLLCLGPLLYVSIPVSMLYPVHICMWIFSVGFVPTINSIFNLNWLYLFIAACSSPVNKHILYLN